MVRRTFGIARHGTPSPGPRTHQPQDQRPRSITNQDHGGSGADAVTRWTCSVSSLRPSNRACGSPAHGSPTSFTAGIRCHPPGPEGPGCGEPFAAAFQDLHRFHGIHPDSAGSALPVPTPKGRPLTTPQASLDATDQSARAKWAEWSPPVIRVISFQGGAIRPSRRVGCGGGAEGGQGVPLGGPVGAHRG